MQFKVAGLYAITPDLEDTARLCQMVEASILGGASVVQYRNKVANEALRFAQASALLPICRQHQIPFIINDHLDLFLALDADGLHIGGDDGDISAAKQGIGKHKILGVSCYTAFSNAEKAEKAGADYVAFGAFFPTTTKQTEYVAEPDLLSWWQELMEIPCVAIGGITPDNMAAYRAAGASGFGLGSALYAPGRSAEQVREKAKVFVQAWARPI